MPRISRGLADGHFYHIINRGNGWQQVFHKDEDYQAFLDLMKESAERYDVAINAYCLMPNHFHLLVAPKVAEGLSRWMQWLMTSHVRRYHRHYRSSGHVWQGRYKSLESTMTPPGRPATWGQIKVAGNNHLFSRKDANTQRKANTARKS